VSRGGGAGAPARRGWRRRGPPARRPGDHVLLYLAGAELRRASKAMADLRVAEVGRPWRICARRSSAGHGGSARCRIRLPLSGRRASAAAGRRAAGRSGGAGQDGRPRRGNVAGGGGELPGFRSAVEAPSRRPSRSVPCGSARRGGEERPLSGVDGGPCRGVLVDLRLWLRRRRAAAAAALACRAAAPPPSPACGADCMRAAARPSSSSRAPLDVAAARCLLTAGFPCSLHRRAASPCPLHPPLARLGGRGEARQSGRGGRASLPCFSSPVAAERGGAAAERGERAEHGRGARSPTRGRGGREQSRGGGTGRTPEEGMGRKRERRSTLDLSPSWIRVGRPRRRSEAFCTSSDSFK
jgi:hypothetical protein